MLVSLYRATGFGQMDTVKFYDLAVVLFPDHLTVVLAYIEYVHK